MDEAEQKNIARGTSPVPTEIDPDIDVDRLRKRLQKLSMEISMVRIALFRLNASPMILTELEKAVEHLLAAHDEALNLYD
jgi:hypothetical protein